MGDSKKSATWFEIASFLCMAGAYAALVIVLLVSPFFSDSPLAWLGVLAGLLLIWAGRGVATGKWSR